MFEHETPASAVPAAGRISTADNAVLNSQQRLRQSSRTPKQFAPSVVVAAAISPSLDSARSTEPRQTKPFRATGTRRRVAGGRADPARDEQGLSAAAHANEVSKQHPEQRTNEHKLEGDYTNKATRVQAVREGFKDSKKNMDRSTTTFAGITVGLKDQKVRGAEKRRGRKENIVAMLRSPNKRPRGLQFRASKARAWHSQQAVQSAATPEQV